MDRFDAGFESTHCCVHKLVINVLNDPVEIKLIRNITENPPNKGNVFFFCFFSALNKCYHCNIVVAIDH